MKKVVLTLAAVALFPLASFGQASMGKNPVSDAVRSILERQSKNLIGAAEEMPADKYSYRPTPEQMTFAHLVAHIAGSNNFLCSKISGTSAPSGEKLSDTDPKDKLVAAVKASFEYCTTSLAKVDDSNLSEELTLFGGRKMTRAAAMIALTDDFADHYSAAASYLRLNGVLPPTAQKKD
ncbi:MAG TPA: DinB family protein [Candidatus Limnocylindrales bacterium]|nr:DinB family protein [Candidatus Limnocylindrales bacterium]